MITTHVHHIALRDLCVAILGHAGVPESDALIVAQSLVLANLRGVDTHGVRRLPSYLELIRTNVVRARSNISIVHEFPSGFCLDAGHSLGQVIADRAMDLAIERARQSGLACVTVRNGGHIGAHGNPAIKAARSGMIGLVLTNGRPALAPPGGKAAAVSSTPFAIAAPSGHKFPLVLDMALGVVARGHILRAMAEGTDIPADWAVDASGQPTRDAAEASRGALLPVGGYKGYGLALMFGMLGGVLSGAAFGSDVAPSEPPDPRQPFNQGHFVLAINIEEFMPLSQFQERAEAFIGEIKAAPRSADAPEIFVPGEQSYRRWEERLESGIPLNEKVMQSLAALCQEAGIDFSTAVERSPRPDHDPFIPPIA